MRPNAVEVAMGSIGGGVRARPSLYARYGKRLLDFSFAATALVFLSPVLVVAAAGTLLAGGRPVFFRQERLGLHGRSFKILKFRTMTERRSESGELLPDGERLTRIGRLLRRTSIDELPELLNILSGDMSVVGPRPLLARYRDRYSPEQFRRHLARPGLTGWAQVMGRNAISWDERFRLDLWYVQHVSLWLDIRIIMKTVLDVVRGAGVSAEGHATMPEFFGPAGDESQSGAVADHARETAGGRYRSG